jgi:outer membrane protein assembly factor BamB
MWTLSALTLTGATVFAFQSSGSAAEPSRAAARTRKAAGAFTAPLAVDWKFTSAYFPNNPVMPIYTDGTIIFCAGNRIHAVDAQSGAQKWRYPLEGNNLQSYIISAPTVHNNTLYFGTGDGLYALDVATGKPNHQPYLIRSGVVTSPIISNDILYIGNGENNILAFDVRTFRPLEGAWSPGGRPGVPGGDFAGNFLSANSLLYYVTGDQTLRAVNTSNGSVRWAQRLNANFQRATPILSGDSLYLAVGTTYCSFRAASGQPRWQITLPADAAADPAVDEEGNSYVGTTDRAIYALDIRGRALWKQPAQVEHEIIASPVIAGDYLIVGTALGGVYVFERATGTLKWHYLVKPSSTNPEFIPSSANVAAPPVVINGSLMVLTDDGTVTTFRNDAPDNLAPLVTKLEPEPGDALNGKLPFHISARLEDFGSGLNPDTIVLKVDDRTVPRRPGGRQFSDKPGYTFDPDLGLLDYTMFENESGISRALARGPHTISITVQDWMGNMTTKSWSFHVDETLPTRTRRRPPNSNQNPAGGLGPGGLGGGKGAGGGGGS